MRDGPLNVGDAAPLSAAKVHVLVAGTVGSDSAAAASAGSAATLSEVVGMDTIVRGHRPVEESAQFLLDFLPFLIGNLARSCYRPLCEETHLFAAIRPSSPRGLASQKMSEN